MTVGVVDVAQCDRWIRGGGATKRDATFRAGPWAVCDERWTGRQSGCMPYTCVVFLFWL